MTLVAREQQASNTRISKQVNVALILEEKWDTENLDWKFWVEKFVNQRTDLSGVSEFCMLKELPSLFSSVTVHLYLSE